jgi:hypothetical protein
MAHGQYALRVLTADANVPSLRKVYRGVLAA